MENIEKAFGKDKAPALVEALEQRLNNIQRKNKEQKIVLRLKSRMG
ncbi:hypothetical protein [Desulfovulcanus sp.]